jgi:hypothetical protein
MYNIYDDWPRDSEEFRNYIIEKYGSLDYAMQNTKYYYDISGNIIDVIEWTQLSSSKRRSETIYEWELRKNTNKSKIKIMQKSSLGALDSGLKSMLVKPIV